MLIVGKSGSGKSTLAREIIRAMQGRYRHLIIAIRKREFAELTQGRYTVSEDGDPWPALKKHRRVIFQITGYDPRPFLDRLGQAVMQYGMCCWWWTKPTTSSPGARPPRGSSRC